ncbi:MAG: hypothetical protein HUJ91_05975, partial [Bacteroidales bacterium]|nr:hypothetical protein [Bacteroidales bacterium]
MKTDTKRLVFFLAVVFALTFAYEFSVVVPMARSCGYGSSPTLMALVALCMFFPSIAVVITRLVTREGFKDAKIRPHFKENKKTYLVAWFAFPVITAVGAVAYFLLFPDRFDPNSGYILQQSAAAGTPVPENLRMFM